MTCRPDPTMGRYLTVSELVDKCDPSPTGGGDYSALTEERRRVWLRRIRHWSTMDILPPAPASRDGTGHHRRYDDEDVYIAAVLLRVADLGISIAITRDIATVLRQPGSADGDNFAECWRQAKAGKPHIYLVIWIASDGWVFVEGVSPEQGGLGAVDLLLDPDDAPTVILSLSKIFARIRR